MKRIDKRYCARTAMRWAQASFARSRLEAQSKASFALAKWNLALDIEDLLGGAFRTGIIDRRWRLVRKGESQWGTRKVQRKSLSLVGVADCSGWAGYVS